MSTKNLHKAKKEKNDEFYTQLSDIENELRHYKDYFKGKVVFCNCDDPEESNFWKYFSLNFEFLGLKKLISTHYESDKNSYKLEIFKDINNDNRINNLDMVKTPLKQNGDFRSDECIEILKECDVVVSNPPFSLFSEYINQLIRFNKKFIVIGNQNAITYKDIFKHIKEKKLWLGYGFNGGYAHFINQHYIDYSTSVNKKDGMIRVSGVVWFTNIHFDKMNEDLILYNKYYGNESKYPKYVNFDGINVDKTKDIPMDYKGYIGVPITFLNKYNPNQFEIISLNGDLGNNKQSKKVELLDKNNSPTKKYKSYNSGLFRLYDKNIDKSNVSVYLDNDTNEKIISIYSRIIIKNKTI